MKQIKKSDIIGIPKDGNITKGLPRYTAHEKALKILNPEFDDFVKINFRGIEISEYPNFWGNTKQNRINQIEKYEGYKGIVKQVGKKCLWVLVWLPEHNNYLPLHIPANCLDMVDRKKDRENRIRIYIEAAKEFLNPESDIKFFCEYLFKIENIKNSDEWIKLDFLRNNFPEFYLFHPQNPDSVHKVNVFFYKEYDDFNSVINDIYSERSTALYFSAEIAKDYYLLND